MPKSFLPILVPGQPEPVRVPCSMPAEFTFHVFLPSRGVRKFTAWLSSSDPLQAEISSVHIDGEEGDPRGPHGYSTDDDEQERADEAAGDVLVGVFNALGIHYATRQPVALSPLLGGPSSPAALHGIARAHLAERAAYDAAYAAHRALPRALHSPALLPADPSDESTRGPSVVMLEAYVEHVLSEAVKAQQAKAEAQRDAHPPAQDDEDAPGSERIRNPRHLGKDVLLCLDVNF